MNWFLMLYLTTGGPTIVPQPYPTQELCEKYGQMTVDLNAQHSSTRYLYYTCVPGIEDLPKDLGAK